MKIYRFYVATNIYGSEVSDEVEFDDDTTDEQVNDFYIGWMYENIESGYEVVEQ